MAKFKVKDLLIPMTLAGVGFFVWQAMQRQSAQKQIIEAEKKGFSLTPKDVSPELKAACDASYKPIGANRYLCYRGLKQPKVAIEGLGRVFL